MFCFLMLISDIILLSGFFMDFISYPVLKGFTSAAAITIAMSQVKVGNFSPIILNNFIKFIRNWPRGHCSREVSNENTVSDVIVS